MAARKDAGLGEIRKASGNFREMLRGVKVTPSGWLLARLNDPDVAADVKDAIAEKLVQYELPRLAAIEVESANVDKSHEEWLAELSAAEAEHAATSH